jgi:hypothetical protein
MSDKSSLSDEFIESIMSVDKDDTERMYRTFHGIESVESSVVTEPDKTEVKSDE